ncbi:MAG: glycosyltransferase [Actinomycetota bacterium]
MSERPLVSVLIACYNAAPYLGEAIESALAQTYRPLELIVVDDGSDDGSGDIARGFAGARVVTQDRGGIGAARNRAVAEARGAYYAFLDADDRFTAEKTEKQLAAFDADPSVDIVFGNVTEFISPGLAADEAAKLREPAVNVPWRSPSLMLVRRDSFERVGSFSTDIRVGITVDWYARAIDLGLKTAEIPVVVLERRLHSSNNGIRERESRSHYLRVLKASIDRRRAQ